MSYYYHSFPVLSCPLGTFSYRSDVKYKHTGCKMRDIHSLNRERVIEERKICNQRIKLLQKIFLLWRKKKKVENLLYFLFYNSKRLITLHNFLLVKYFCLFLILKAATFSIRVLLHVVPGALRADDILTVLG